jgi:hypothetical protein
MLTVEEHAPRARCYDCGSPTIFSLCHHCGKSMCHQHSSKAVDAFKKPVSRELADLGLKDPQASTYHCAEHDHVVEGGLRGLIWAGVAIAVVGLVLAGIAVAAAGLRAGLANMVAGLVLMLAGAGLAAGAYRAHRRRKAAELSVRPFLPVVPGLKSISVRETLRGHVSLDEDGNYTSTPQRTGGTVEIVMALAPSDRHRLGIYRNKYSLAPGDPVEFSAGFAVLKGEVGLTFQPGPEHHGMLLPGGTSLAFRGSVTDHPLFSATPGQPAEQWRIRLPYGLQGSRVPRSIPIWIVPSLVPSSDKRALVLELRWIPIEPDRPGGERRPLSFKQFESIELTVPKSWGYVQSASPAAIVSDPESEKFRTIEWKRLASPGQEENMQRDEPGTDSPAEGDGEAAASDSTQPEDSPQPSRPPQPNRPPQVVNRPPQSPRAEDSADEDDDSAEDDQAEAASLITVDGRGRTDGRADEGHQILIIRFADKIKPSDKISGHLRASFQSTLSGITDVRMCQSAGRLQPRIRPPKSTIELEVTIDFELSLSSVRYQDARAVPNRDRLKIDRYPGVIPDFETVVNLTNELSDQGCYVKRVVENPPRGSWCANRVNRYWDIAGRRYHGIFPIDFRITLTGEEEYGSGVRPTAGDTDAQLTVYGSYVNETMTGEVTTEDELQTEYVVTPEYEMTSEYEAMPAYAAPPESEVTAEYEVTKHGQLTMKGQIEKEWAELRSIVDANLKGQGKSRP